MAKTEILNNDAVTLRVADEVADIVEDVVDTVENVVTVTKNNPLVVAAAFGIGAAIAGFVAYKIAVKRTSLKYEDILAEEIAAAKAFHKRLAKDGEFESPESAVQALVPEEVVDAVHSYQGRPEKVPYNKIEVAEGVKTVVAETAVVTRNVFADARPDPRDWDYDRELKIRAEHPDEPYVISFEEFNENEPGHDQSTLTYYVQDDTLADSRDQPIDNTDYVVGDDNLLRFGEGSGDKTVVYIRNEKTDSDFEVIRDMGSFQKAVLGVEPNLKHSQRQHPRRFRGTDE